MVTARAHKLTTAFWILMALSALALFLPRGATEGLKHVMQLLVPTQDAIYNAARKTSQRLSQAAGLGAAETLREYELREAALENEVVALSGQMEQVRRENSLLRGLREKFVPPGVLLVPARVVARDIGGWRDSLLLSRGASQRVQHADAVASRLFVSGGTADGVAVGHLVLAREFLLGRIEQVGPFTSRLQLYSDVGVRTEVRVGRVAGGRFQPVPYACTLLGMGGGQMRIVDIPLSRIAEGPHVSGRGDSSARSGAANASGVPGARGASDASDGMRTGDLVTTPPGAIPGLPTPMTIGRIKGFTHDPSRRLVAAAEVETLAGPDDLADVFIIATGPRS